MSKFNRTTKMRKQDRCSLSGQSTEGKEVILAKYAILYVKKMGFVVLPSIDITWENFKKLNMEVKHGEE